MKLLRRFPLLILFVVLISSVNVHPETPATAVKTATELAVEAEELATTGDPAGAEKLYFQAIKMSGEGWLWVKLAQFYDRTAQYEKVIKVTNNKIRIDFPGEIDKVAPQHNRAVEVLGPIKTKGIPLFSTTSAQMSSITLSSQSIPQRPSLTQKQSVDIIRETCEGKWRDDYSMIEYCIHRQSDAMAQVAEKPEDQIKKSCTDKWGADYTMVAYCIDKQTQAKARLEGEYSMFFPGKKASIEEIECKRKWGDNQESVRKCMQAQYAVKVAEIDRDIEKRKIDLSTTLSGMLDDYLAACKKDHQRGSEEYNKCMQYVDDERAKLKTQYDN